MRQIQCSLMPPSHTSIKGWLQLFHQSAKHQHSIQWNNEPGDDDGEEIACGFQGSILSRLGCCLKVRILDGGCKSGEEPIYFMGDFTTTPGIAWGTCPIGFVKFVANMGQTPHACSRKRLASSRMPAWKRCLRSLLCLDDPFANGVFHELHPRMQV